MSFDITKYMRACTPIIFVQTAEPHRAEKTIFAQISGDSNAMSADAYAAHTKRFGQCKVRVYKDITDIGCRDIDRDSMTIKIGNAPLANDIVGTLKLAYKGAQIKTGEEKFQVYIIHNPIDVLKAPIVIQYLQDIAQKFPVRSSHIIFIGTRCIIPEELQDLIQVVTFGPPNHDEMGTTVSEFISRNCPRLKGVANEPEITRALLGMTASKAIDTMARSLVEIGDISSTFCQAKKAEILNESGFFELDYHKEDISNLGGFSYLKEFVELRKKYFEDPEAAHAAGMSNPKGILLVGQPGCGKSLSARIIASILGLPLVKFNIGAIFGRYVGDSESAMTRALKMAEYVAPCVLMIDEMEKALAGLGSSGMSDSGVTSRVIGQLMTWMQECKAPIFKVGTCNTIRNLDGAMLRRGRWDEIMAVDLPNTTERAAIFGIHLRKRKQDSSNFNLIDLADASDTFVGAEIEAAVEAAVVYAFSYGVNLTQDILMTECKRIVPLAVTAAEEIAMFREWAKGRAISVNYENSKTEVIEASEEAMPKITFLRDVTRNN